MAHPHKSGSKSTAKTKMSSMLGRKVSGAKHSDESMDRAATKKMVKDREFEVGKVQGKKSGGRLDRYARGGKVKAKAGNNVNIVIATKPKEDAEPLKGMPMMPPGPPMGMPPGGPPMPPPGMAGPGGPPPGGPPPMMRAAGGRAGKYIPGVPTDSSLKSWAQYAAKNSYARGGGTKYTGGAESGVGRLEKIKSYGLKPK